MTDWSTRPQPVGESRWRFPPASDWPDGDVIAAGGDLEPATLVAAYRQGLFPMSIEGRDRVLGWWSPDPRGIVPLDGLRVTKSMRQSAKRFEVRIDTCFADVIRACGDPSRESGWITDDFIERLHGHAPARMGAQRRGLRSRGAAGRRPVRRAHQRAVRGRIDVLPAARRVEGGADGARRRDAAVRA